MEKINSTTLPRLPLTGCLDLTYRCNNQCRHCWVFEGERSKNQKAEMTFAEIRSLVDQARSLGCREWYLSGGEPLLHPEFIEIFDYLSYRSVRCHLNTNGTLITPAIAQLLNRPGRKMVSLYGATAEVHDWITRQPGSFEAALQGMTYLKEAGVSFFVQIVPLKDNLHQYDEMVQLALSLSPHYRLGAYWLYLSAEGSFPRNREIARQRLSPDEVIRLNPPEISDWESREREQIPPVSLGSECDLQVGHGLLDGCAIRRREFHIDPYGQMTFCQFIKDSSLRYDLRKGSFEEAWEHFIPSLVGQVQADEEYAQGCGSCANRSSCSWCPVYAYLETGRYTSPIPYLCELNRANYNYIQTWQETHRNYFTIAGLTIQLEADIPITDETFNSALKIFRVQEPGDDQIVLRHHFYLPDFRIENLGTPVYQSAPWTVYHLDGSWIFIGSSQQAVNYNIHQVLVFNDSYTAGNIYNLPETAHFFHNASLPSLTLTPSDQILLSRVLADRQAFYLHASGMVIQGEGLVFVGHSEAGKSTTARMLKDEGELLCDDRVIIRRWPEGFRVHGTWSHGEIPEVSPGSAPLRGVFLLEQAPENRMIRLHPSQALRALPEFVVKGLVTRDWWEKILDVFGSLAREVPVYRLRLDKSGAVKQLLRAFLNEPA